MKENCSDRDKNYSTEVNVNTTQTRLRHLCGQVYVRLTATDVCRHPICRVLHFRLLLPDPSTVEALNVRDRSYTSLLLIVCEIFVSLLRIIQYFKYSLFHVCVRYVRTEYINVLIVFYFRRS